MPEPSSPESLISALVDIVGDAHVLRGAAVEGYATDVYRSVEWPLAVVRPDTVADLRSIARAASAADTAMYVRGGGASYTDAYLPTRRNALLIDMSGLNRLVEINETDGYVTAEAGLSWAALKAALDARGLRTPFFGPFSGIAATLGGALSQHAISHGSGAHGISAQSVISLDVVTADGSLLRTGSASRAATPFSRWYGPDLTGLFTGDCGIFGIKAAVTLALRRRAPAFECASYALPDLRALAHALHSVAMEGLDDEHFAMDAAMTHGQIARQARVSKFTLARDLAAATPGAWHSLKQLLHSAVRGTRELAAAPYSAHFILEGLDRTVARLKARRLRELLRAAGGIDIGNTVPALVRSKPFAPLFNTLGPNGERWAPLHGYLPYSKVASFHEDVQQLLRERQSLLQRLGIWCGGMFMSAGASTFLYEIALYWPGVPSAYHRLTLPADYLAALPRHPEREEVAHCVGQIRGELIALYTRHQAVHFQLGKTYPYGSLLSGEPLGLLRAVKSALDPKHLLNPDALEI